MSHPKYAWVNPTTEARLSVKYPTVQDANEHHVANAVLYRCDEGEWTPVAEHRYMPDAELAVRIYDLLETDPSTNGELVFTFTEEPTSRLTRIVRELADASLITNSLEGWIRAKDDA